MALLDGDDFASQDASFSLKMVISDLTVTDGKEDFKDVLLTMTFDENVIKIEDFVKNDDGTITPIGHGFNFRLAPKRFIKKLHLRPILFNLARGCAELGTSKLDISDCFIKVVTCKEFLSETCTSDISFSFEGQQNAELTLVLQLTRVDDDDLFKGMKKPTNAEELPELDSSSPSSSCSGISFPSSIDDDSVHCEQTRPSKSCDSCHKTPSKSKSSRSKCNSDIATSLDIGEVSNNQQTFCNGCGKYSVSGVTCDNKNSGSNGLPSPCKSQEKVSSKIQLKPITGSKRNCGKPPGKPHKRICAECFEDLSVIPGDDAPCPKCNYNAQLERKLVIFKSEDDKANECDKVRDCIKTIFEELFLDAKDRLLDDWQRLKRKKKKKSKGKNNERRCSDMSTIKQPKRPKMPRCSKTMAVQRLSKLPGLRKKHPGVVLGHQFCKGDGLMVPKDMGWLWNIGITGLPHIRRGWRPGAVKKSVAKIMKAFLKPPDPCGPNVVPKEPPTLRVFKQNGETMIVMNPLVDRTKFVGKVSPIVFKITKSEEGKKRLSARKTLKKIGFTKTCECINLESCYCIDDNEKNLLRSELYKISRKLNLTPEVTYCDLKDSSDSELDVEYTPPSAANLKNPCNKGKLKKYSYAETQYEAQSGNSDDDCKNRKDCDNGDSDNKPKKRKIRPRASLNMKDIPCKSCCNCCGPVIQQHRFTTNYAPMYAQCPPRPSAICCPSIPFYY